jgi:glycosyltransferase involved in cell wall biosynthesis
MTVPRRAHSRAPHRFRVAAGAQHVLLVVENVPLARDHRLQKQVGSLASSGYRVSVICRADPDNGGDDAVRLYEYRAPADAASKLGYVREYAYSWLMAALLTLRVFVAEPFDAIQVSGTPDVYFLIGAPFKLLRRRLVVDQRDLSPELYEARYGRRSGVVLRMLRWLERRSYRCADHVVTVNRALERVVYRRAHLPWGRVSVVGNGPALSTLPSLRPRHELRRGRRHLLCWVGLMGPQDRVDLALRAVAHLVHVIGRRDVQVAFIGDGESRAASERLAAELGLADRVTFTGWLRRDDVYAYLASADLGLESNLEEIVSPVKAMEYLAFGLPLAGFDLRETRLVAGEAGAYAPPGDVEALAGLVDALLGDPERRAEMGRIGRRRVARTLCWERQQEVYLDVYRHLVGAPPGRWAASSLRRAQAGERGQAVGA